MPSTTTSQILRDGDTSFLGLQSRRNPLTIDPKYLQVAKNIRLDRGIAQTRKGAKRISSGIAVSGSPLSLPFNLSTPGPTLHDIYGGGLFSAGVYSSPVYSNSNEFIAIVGPSAGYLWRWDTTTTPPSSVLTTLGYPSGDSVKTGDITQVLQAFDKLFIFRWRPSDIPLAVTSVTINTTSLSLSALTYSGPTITATTGSTAHGLVAGQQITFSGQTGATSNANLNGTWLITTIPTTTSFTFVVTTAPTASLTATSGNVSSGSASIVTSSAHGFQTNDVVRISGTSSSGLNIDGTITLDPTTPTTKFSVPVSALALVNTNSTALFAQRVQSPLYWDGITSGFVRASTTPNANGVTFSNLIASKDAIVTFYNNQLVVASGRDTILISDILNPFNFDPPNKGFRTNVGSNDYLTAIHPYADDNILAFCRKSIYLGKLVVGPDGVSPDASQSFLQLLTNEIGCNARATIATAGNYVYFLSDNGVYRLDNSQIDLALRGNTLPLSEPIADIIATINTNAVSKAIGIYFNNRYYLAIPTTDSQGNVSTSNNTLAVYNQLNEAWESIDNYPFTLDQLVISTYGTLRRLFAISSLGTLMLLEEYDAPASSTADFGDDPTDSTLPITPVIGSLTTRRYFYGQLSPKRFQKTTISAFIPAQSQISVTANLIDRDSSVSVASVTNPDAILTPSSVNGNDYTIKGPIRKNAEYLDVTISTSKGRPTIRAVMVDAALPIDPSFTARTES